MRVQDLRDELDRLQDHEGSCHRLTDLLDDESQELDLDSGEYQLIARGLAMFSDVLARRVAAVDELLEAEANKSMDRFRRRVR